MDKSKWEYKKLGDCFAYIKNGANIKQISGATGIPITRIETLSNDVFNRDRMGYANIDDVASYSSNILNDGDILMSHINSMKFLGRAVEYKKKDDEIIIHGMNLLRMIPTSNFLSSYAVYQFKTDHFRKQVKAISHQAVNQASFNVTNLKGLNLIVPPVADQQRIVAELDCLNEMIALKQEQLKEFDKLAQSIFYDMFGDPGDNVHEWEISILEDVVSENCSISYGIVQPGDDVENGVPVVRPVDLVNQIVYRDGLKIVDKAISDSYKRTILNGDELLFCVRGTTGIISFASEELEGCNVTRGITPLEFADRIDKYYAYYLLKTPYLQSLIAEKTNGIALKQINMRDVRLLPIMCPPLALQQQFAEKIQAIEAQKELVKQSIAETQQLLDSRMDYYFD